MDTKNVIAASRRAAALAMMEHPNIARVLDAGTTETGRPYFIMELVRGVALPSFATSAARHPQRSTCSSKSATHPARPSKGIIHATSSLPTFSSTARRRAGAKVIDFGSQATEAADRQHAVHRP